MPHFLSKLNPSLCLTCIPVLLFTIVSLPAGYHGFCAVPTSLGDAANDCCYVAGLLKHAGEPRGGRLQGM